MKTKLVLLIIVVGIYLLTREPSVVAYGPGVTAAEAPVQRVIGRGQAIGKDGYRIIPLADFRIKAKVLSRENYRVGREAELSPVDLALGWGPMSDEQVLAHFKISQGGRWYQWWTQKLPLPRRVVETHSANMHLIPANDWVEDRIDEIAKGQVIELTGKLVRVEASDGWRWQSSMTRNDTGARSCELIWVESVELL